MRDRKMKHQILKKKSKKWSLGKRAVYGHTMMFWPLIVAGGQLVVRVILNAWNMIEG